MTVADDQTMAGCEVCQRMSSGQARMDIEDAISAENGIDFASAVWVYVQARDKLCPAY
jgi:hypothetical protein